MNPQRACIAICLVAAFNSPMIFAQNLLVNPSFETAPDGIYIYLPAGSTHLPGWTPVLSGAEVFSASDVGGYGLVSVTIPDGFQAVDLLPPPAHTTVHGGIQQSFPATVGD